ncbi:MAG: DUF368 domain-containing protein [Clostridia bacterium]|nr:DUF368 domain-containing protein [Clostridia bacterium]
MQAQAAKNENTLPQILYRVFVGILFGFANVIPGVSGGTVMVVLGVYERIIGIITDFFKKIKTEWKFFLPILAGMGIAIILFGKIMSALLDKHAQVTQMFFIGVIVFSIPGILKKAITVKKTKKNKKRRRSKKTDVCCVIAFVLMLALMVFMYLSPANDEKAALKAEKEQTEEILAEVTGEGENAPASEKEEYDPDHSAGHLVMLFVYGAVAAATMIIPGISGSLVMVMLGQYKGIMDAVAHFDIIYLLPFGAGVLLGIVFCAKGIKWLLKHHERVTYSAILGFVVGSILPVFPGWKAAISLAGIIAFLIGGACIVACDLLAPKSAKA